MLLREAIFTHRIVERSRIPGPLSTTPDRIFREYRREHISSIVTESTNGLERIEIRDAVVTEKVHMPHSTLKPSLLPVPHLHRRHRTSRENPNGLAIAKFVSPGKLCLSKTDPTINDSTIDNSARINVIENKIAANSTPPAPRIFKSLQTTFDRLKKAWTKNEDGKREYGKFIPELVRCVLMSPLWLIGVVYAGPRHLADNIRHWATEDLQRKTPKHSKLFWGACSLLSVPIRLAVPAVILILHFTTGIGGIAITLFLEAVVISEEVIKSTEGKFENMMVYRAIDDLIYGLELIFSSEKRKVE